MFKKDLENLKEKFTHVSNIESQSFDYSVEISKRYYDIQISRKNNSSLFVPPFFSS